MFSLLCLSIAVHPVVKSSHGRRHLKHNITLASPNVALEKSSTYATRSNSAVKNSSLNTSKRVTDKRRQRRASAHVRIFGYEDCDRSCKYARYMHTQMKSSFGPTSIAPLRTKNFFALFSNEQFGHCFSGKVDTPLTQVVPQTARDKANFTTISEPALF